MAEILTEQLDALKEGKHHSKKSKHTGTADGKQEYGGQEKSKLPKGMILDKEGKPCRTCVSISDWRALMKGKSPNGATPSSSSKTTTTSPTTTTQNQAITAPLPPDCPPDVETLGRSTWTLLHSMTATYPTTATHQQQTDMRSFLTLFGKLYPCWVCADDFRAWMNEPSGANKPRLKTRAEFGNWMCEAHNEVNRKLGKEVFDCGKWEERWRTGWKDGRCD
ncbi:hypothetical protein GX50_06021 [[Emmonsia] crescens]|uniref:Sulfhydryl oxidase n=1 Tax=[Emmonsia] crescens TaxID=73230 RepID=A0A2B7ZDB4_9EURO|nr:hypothetical protein GX50_06021 [Emmonsia crescens]